MDVYEHHFDEERHQDFHDNMLEQIAEKEKEYVEQLKQKRTKRPLLTVIDKAKETDSEVDIQALLNDLEDE